VIFTQWKATIDVLHEQVFAAGCPLAHLQVGRLDGSVPEGERQALVDRVNEGGALGLDVLMATTSAGGQGLNLTGANVVVFMEHDWNPVNDLQAMDRTHRLGQRRTVSVFRIVTQSTVEQRVLGIQKFKANLSRAVVKQSAALGAWGPRVLEMFGDDDDGDHAADGDRQLLIGAGESEETASDREYDEYKVGALVRALNE
jgi:TATA-binding protein-associated factor